MAKDIKDYLEHSDGTIAQRAADLAHAFANKRTAEELQQQMVDETAERNNLSDEEIEDFLYENYQDKESTEYIVDGAILTCTNCTIEDQYIKNEMNPSGAYEAMTKYYYYAPIDESIQRSDFPDIGKKALGRLTVTENPAAEANSLKYATVTDSLKGRNIPYFGNCLRAPDNESEMSIFSAIHNEADQGIEKRKEGSCKYLMKLESEWENYEIGQNFLSFPDDIKGKQSGITMTSMLFCRHGGFIYPVTSGQVKVEEEVEEEIVEEDCNLAIDILDNYLRDGEFEEEKLEWALNYLAGQSEYKLVEYRSLHGYDYNKYDTYILGWTEYYNKSYDVKIDPNYIKAQCYEESRVGNGYKGIEEIPAANLERDIMQALDVRNYNIYEYIGISPERFSILKSDGSYITGRDIWALNLGVKGASEPEPDKYNEGKKERCGGIIETLFNKEIDGTGDCYYEGSKEIYYYQLDTVTPIMSIGISLDKMCELFDKHSGDYYESLKEYNGSDNKEAYANDIMGWAQTEADFLNME